MSSFLLSIYTVSPLHVGCGSSVGAIDLPVTRERITHFPLIPGSSLKGVLLQAAREKWGNARSSDVPAEACLLFGSAAGSGNDSGQAGSVQIQEGILVAFPVRSLRGGFAWLTSPITLHRLQRLLGTSLDIPKVDVDTALAGSEITSKTTAKSQVVLEEYTLEAVGAPAEGLISQLEGLTGDPLWKDHIRKRLAIVSDENFQHFVTTCTEVVTRVAIDPATRTVKNGALFNQENVPAESLFASRLTALPARGKTDGDDPARLLQYLLPSSGCLLQVGGDETTGLGQCRVELHPVPLSS